MDLTLYQKITLLIGPADRLLIYLILFISECLTKLAATPGKQSPGFQEATKVLSTLSVDTFALPGDAGFPLNSLYHAPASRNDAGRSFRLYKPEKLGNTLIVKRTMQMHYVATLRRLDRSWQSDYVIDFTLMNRR